MSTDVSSAPYIEMHARRPPTRVIASSFDRLGVSQLDHHPPDLVLPHLVLPFLVVPPTMSLLSSSHGALHSFIAIHARLTSPLLRQPYGPDFVLPHVHPTRLCGKHASPTSTGSIIIGCRLFSADMTEDIMQETTEAAARRAMRVYVASWRG